MLKSYVPAKANLNEGITIRQQSLERIKFKRNEPSGSEQTVYDAEYNAPEITEDNTYLYNDLAGNKAAFYTGEISGSNLNIGEEYSVQENPYALLTGSINQSLFNHSDYNVLLNNVSSSRLSLDRLKIEIQPFTSSNLLVPVELQDSYESLTSYQLSRHDGVKLSSLKYNTYTTASSTYVGDNSYGQTAAIDRYSDKIGLFTEVVTSSAFPTRLNARLRYLVDRNGNLTELNTDNKYWFDVQNFFLLNNNSTITLFNDQQYSNQKSTNGSKLVFNSGYSYYPMLYYSSSTDTTLFFEYSNVTSLTFNATNTLGIASSSVTSDYPINAGNIYNAFSNIVSNDGGYYKVGTSSVQLYPTYSVPTSNNYIFNGSLDVTLNQTSSLNTSVSVKLVSGSITLYTSSINLTNKNTVNTKPGWVFYDAGTAPTSLSYFTTDTLKFDTYDELGNLVALSGSTIYLYNLYGGYSTNNCTFASNDAFIAFTTASINSSTFWVNSGPGWGGFGVAYCFGQTLKEALYPNVPVYNLYSLTYDNSTSKTLSFNTPPLFLNNGDKIAFQVSTSLASNVSSLTLGYGTLGVTLDNKQGINIVGINNFSNDKNHTFTTPNTIVLNNSLKNVLNYTFYPFTGSNTSTGYNTLYSKYGDIEYPFNPEIGDILRFPTAQQEYEFTITNTLISGSSLYLTVAPGFVTSNVFGSGAIQQYVYLKRVKDETNVILNATKRDGKTSYGFLLPPNLTPTLLNNIDTIARQIQQKLNLTQ
jgi:hypothetical protein